MLSLSWLQKATRKLNQLFNASWFTLRLCEMLIVAFFLINALWIENNITALDPLSFLTEGAQFH